MGKTINKPVKNAEWIKRHGPRRLQGGGEELPAPGDPPLEGDNRLRAEPGAGRRGAWTQWWASDINNAFPYLDSANISINDMDAVVLTHAHMDHVGFVPYLFKFGYTGPVYCTPPTRDLATLFLNDYIRLVQKTGGTPLYGEKDVRSMLMHTITRDSAR